MKQLCRTQRSAVLGLIVILLNASMLGQQTAHAFSASDDRPIVGGTFVYLFEWPWNDVAQECEQVLGPTGYTAVLVSPPNEHALINDRTLAVFPWWQRYQPVSFRLDRTRSGTRAEFAMMVARCRAAGLAVYVDAVFNHMARPPKSDGNRFLRGSAGSYYNPTWLSYPYGIGAKDFHPLKRPPCHNPGGDVEIKDSIVAQDQEEEQRRIENLWFCQLRGMPDLDTGSARIQQRIVAYLSDLVFLGVSGFRIDAAKHIPPRQLDAILQQVGRQVAPRQPFYFFEMSYSEATRAPEADYVQVNNRRGSLPPFFLDSDYNRLLTELFRSVTPLAEAAPRLRNDYAGPKSATAAQQLVGTHRLVTFIDTHDMQRQHIQGPVLYHIHDTYALAVAFLLAWPHGYPMLMSSYALGKEETDPFHNAGPPADEAGMTIGPYSDPESGQRLATARCFNFEEARGWVCEHRWLAIAGMVGFRRAMQGEQAITNWWDNGSNQIAFGVGARGFVVINNEARPLQNLWQTALPDGEYCNVAADPFDREQHTCGGAPYVVQDGRLYASQSGSLQSVHVPPFSALAIHTEAQMYSASAVAGKGERR